MSKKVYVLGHRGASYQAPENTEASFKKAIELGADGIETDVQLTADDKLVINHNYCIDANSDGTGCIADMTLAQLREHNFNIKKPEFGRQEILTLDSCLELVRPLEVINLELKSPVRKKELYLDMVCAALDRHSLWSKVIISSFDHELLARLAAKRPSAQIGTLMMGFGCTAEMLKGMFGETMPMEIPCESITRDMLLPYAEGKPKDEADAQVFEAYEMAISIAAIYPGCSMSSACELMARQSDIPQYIAGLPFTPRFIHPDFGELLAKPEQITSLNRRGFLINPWTVDAPDDMKKLIEYGCNALITNRCDIALKKAKENL